MIKHNHKLEWLSDRLSELNDDYETVKGEIEATTDVLAEKKLEKRLNIIFGKIEHIKNEIQQEQNNLNNKLVRKKFEDMIAILQSNESLWEQIQQAYQNTRSNWSTKVKDDVDNVQSIVNELNKISQGSLTYSALDEFIANLFHKISDVVVANDLTQWSKEYCQSKDWLSLYEQIQESQDKRLEKAQPAIVITITRSDEASTESQDGETYYQLESWLIEDIDTYQTKKTGFHPLLTAGFPESAPYLLEEILQNIPHLLNRLLSAQRKHCKGCENYPQIHIFLPPELIYLDVDVWLLENSKRPKYLGHDHLVFIRCSNRYDGSYDKYPTWIKLWKRHQDLLKESAQDVFVSGHDKDLDKLIEILHDAVLTNPKAVGLQVTDAPVDTENLVRELLDSGLPLAIWLRSNLAKSVHRSQVSKMLADCCLETLPATVKNKRFETRLPKHTKVKHIGHHLSLLWDDPYFYPPKSA